MRSLLLLFLYFTLTPLLLIVCLFYLVYLTSTSNGNQLKASNNRVVYAALPSNQNIVNDEIVGKDARVEIVREFFAKYKSPLEPYAQNVINSADTYGLDYRLIPAIAMQESNLCKKTPPNSNNCWGFGIYGGNVKRFDSLAQAIETVTKTLAKDYKEGMNLVEPHEIMTKYTPGSNGSWAKSVNYFMENLKITL